MAYSDETPAYWKRLWKPTLLVAVISVAIVVGMSLVNDFQKRASESEISTAIMGNQRIKAPALALKVLFRRDYELFEREELAGLEKDGLERTIELRFARFLARFLERHLAYLRNAPDENLAKIAKARVAYIEALASSNIAACASYALFKHSPNWERTEEEKVAAGRIEEVMLEAVFAGQKKPVNRQHDATNAARQRSFAKAALGPDQIAALNLKSMIAFRYSEKVRCALGRRYFAAISLLHIEDTALIIADDLSAK